MSSLLLSTLFQVIVFVYNFRSVSERGHVKICIEKPRGWTAQSTRAFCAVAVIRPEVM